jgi:hypothetical protein
VALTRRWRSRHIRRKHLEDRLQGPEHSLQKIPVLLVVDKKEAEMRQVSVAICERAENQCFNQRTTWNPRSGVTPQQISEWARAALGPGRSLRQRSKTSEAVGKTDMARTSLNRLD